MEYKMKLTDEEKAILQGSQGETMQKVMRTLVLYGDTFDAEKMVPLTHKASHLVTSFGLGMITPVYNIMDELIQAGIVTEEKFTMDPRPLDYENVKCNFIEKLVFNKFMYTKQDDYEAQLKKVGLKDDNAFSCTCYLEQVGNIPKKGDVISWAESSAVVYANSVLGARCNRNSALIELFGSIAGVVPYFGLLTDEGRKADWIIEVKTSKIPEAQVLGSAIGLKVMEDVPYIVGLDPYLGTEIDARAQAYLKDMGAATASNGAVGLFHVENLTPEAKEHGRALIKEGAQTFVVDDKVLEQTIAGYPIMWKDKEATPKLCFIGCPHLSLSQLDDWTAALTENLEKNGKSKVQVRTVLTSAPDVIEAFKKTENYRRLLQTGATLTSICPLMYMNNPIAGKKAVMTNSNKLRTYTMARYYTDAEVLERVCGKEGI